MIRFVVISVALLVGWGLAGCGSALSATDLGNLAKDDSACVSDAAAKDQADYCRAVVHKVFCAAHPGVGDMCLADGGAK